MKRCKQAAETYFAGPYPGTPVGKNLVFYLLYTIVA